MPEHKDDLLPLAEEGREGLTLASSKRSHLAVLAFFLALALALSYPLIARFSTHVPGSATWAFDEYTFVWNNWWFKQAILDRHSSPLHSDLLFFPLGIDLILHTYNFFNALIALPLQMVMSLPAASNVTLVLSTVLSGYGVYLLTRYALAGSIRMPKTALPLASCIAGLVYAFAANRAVYAAVGHYDMVTTQWLPFYALYLLKTVRADKRQCLVRYALLAGLFFTLAVLSEMIFGVFLGIFTLLVLAFGVRRSGFGVQRWNLKPETLRAEPQGEAWNLKPIWGLVVIGVTVAVLWSPVLVPIGREFASGEYALEGWGEAIRLSADLVGLFTPTALHPLGGADWVRELRAVEEGTARFADVHTVFLGYFTLALALLGLLRYRRRVRVWGWTALIFGLFCLGPFLQINGRYRFDLDGLEATFPLPYALLHYVPIVQANRAPNRNSVLLMLGLAVLAGFGTHFLLQLLGTKALRAEATEKTWGWKTLFLSLFSIISFVILFEHLSLPMPLTDTRVPAVYEQIAAEAGEFAVMHLPLGWRTSFGPLGSERTQIQMYQTVHGKPIIGGNIARAPSFKMAYFQRIPLFRALADVEMYRQPDAETDAAARAQAAGLMQLYDVRYLVVLPPIPGRWPYQDTYARTWEYARQVLPLESEPFYDQEGVRAYRVLQPPLVFPLEVDLGTAEALPCRGAGWHDDEVIFGDTANWAAATEAEIFFPLREVGVYGLSLRIAPFSYPGAAPQSLQVLLNGQPLGQPQLLSEGWQVLDVSLPADAVQSGLNRLQLRFARLERPRDVLPGETAIGATGVATPVDIEIEAAADHAYISVYDEAGAKTDGSTGRRGYNVAVLDARTGRLLDKRGFDTWANEYEAQRLAEFVAQIPEGRLVVVATRDDAGQHLTAEAVAALRSLGAQADSRGAAGQAHALIGVKGAAPGTALELVAAPNAWLRLGRNPDRRPLAAAVDWLRVDQ